MGGYIPRTIKIDVIRKWLQGKSRDQIAKEVGIGAGTVSGIFNECRENDPEFDLLREVARMLKKEDLDVNSFASSIRVHRKLQDEGLSEGQVESFIEDMDVHCFKRGLKAEDFINTIQNVSSVSHSLGIPVDKVAEYIKSQEEKVKEVKEELADAEMRETGVTIDYNISIDTLAEYESNGPLAEKLTTTQMELENVKSQRDYLEDELANKERQIYILEYERSVPVDQLVLLNKKLDTPLDRKEFSDIQREICYHLSKYPDIIKIVRGHRERPSSTSQKATIIANTSN